MFTSFYKAYEKVVINRVRLLYVDCNQIGRHFTITMKCGR